MITIFTFRLPRAASMLFCLVFSILTQLVHAQEQDLKLIEKGKFEKLEKRLEEDLTKDPGNLEAHFVSGILFMTKSYPKFDIQKAYEHLVSAKKAYVSISDPKEMEKLNKVPLNKQVIDDNLDSVGRISLAIYQEQPSIERYEFYLKTYVELPLKYLTEAQVGIYNIDFESAKKAHTEAAYDAHVKTYPRSTHLIEATELRNQLAYETAKSIDNISAYKKFISKYPDAKQVKTANSRIEELAFYIAKDLNKSDVYKQYMQDFPKSAFYKEANDLFHLSQYKEVVTENSWSNYKNLLENYPDNRYTRVAKDSILSIALRTQDFFALEYVVKNMGTMHYQKAIVPFYNIFSQLGTIEAIEYFKDHYDESGVQAKVEKDEARIYETIEAGYDSDDFIKVMAPSDPAYRELISLIEPELKQKKWNEALRKVKSYQTYFGSGSKKYTSLIQLLETPYDGTIKVSNFGKTINSAEGDEYIPVITGDDKTLYFCAKNRWDNVGGEDIYTSEKINGQWTEAVVLGDLSGESSNDAPVSVSTDGNTLILFISGDLFYSEKSIYGWNEPVRFPNTINSNDWQADGIYTSDGKAFLYTAQSPDGYDFLSTENYTMDIFVAEKDANGNWKKPINLGSMINTPYNDRTPFLHPDMKTLYFSSNGHGGLGGFDVYKSTRLAETCWTCWSEPINLGKEINTVKEDWGYKISTNGDRAIFAKSENIYSEEASGSAEICWLNLPKHLRPDYVSTISGALKDHNGKPVSATIRWEDLSTGKIVGESKTDPKDGSFFIVLPLGKIYGYFVDNNEYFPISNSLDLRKEENGSEVSKDIELTSFKEMIENGLAVPVNNLFYATAKSELLPYSIPELKRVAKIIVSRNLKIEVSGHTDSDGDDAENLVLSQKRAEAAKAFLIKEGVAPENITTIGHGESKPVASNDTEEGKAKNRRVEIRIL